MSQDNGSSDLPINESAMVSSKLPAFSIERLLSKDPTAKQTTVLRSITSPLPSERKYYH